MTEQKTDFQTWIQDHIFSPTEIEAYQLCPYRFYLQSFLQMKPDFRNEIELTPPEVGQYVHALLDDWLSQLSNAGALPNIDQAKAWVTFKFDELKTERPALSSVLLRQQRDRIVRMLESFLEDYRWERSQDRSLIPRYFEWTFGYKSPLVIPDASKKTKPVLLRGRIDRIDVDDVNKTFLVVDYKTGSSKITGNQIRSGQSLQLPIYVMAVKQLLLPDYEPIGGLYYQLSDMSKKDGLLHADRIPSFLEIGSRSSSLVKAGEWDSVISSIRNKIVDIASQIRNANFPSCAEACETYCAFQDICRLRSSTGEVSCPQ